MVCVASVISKKVGYDELWCTDEEEGVENDKVNEICVIG